MQTTVQPRKLLTPAECQLLTGASRTTTYELIKRLPTGMRIKIGRLVRVDAKAFEEWLAAGGDLAGSEPS